MSWNGKRGPKSRRSLVMGRPGVVDDCLFRAIWSGTPWGGTRRRTETGAEEMQAALSPKAENHVCLHGAGIRPPRLSSIFALGNMKAFIAHGRIHGGASCAVSLSPRICGRR